MTELNPINLNSPSVTNNTFSKPEEDTKEKPKAESEVSAKIEMKYMPADKVLGYMAEMASQSNVKMSPMALVHKYNTPEQIQRISKMVGEIFEAGVDAWKQRLEEEMGATAAYQGLAETDKLSLSAELYARNE